MAKDEQEPLSRQAYRRQHKEQQEPTQEKRVGSFRRRIQPKDERDKPTEDQIDENEPNETRSGNEFNTRRSNHQNTDLDDQPNDEDVRTSRSGVGTVEFKVQRLKHKLNIAIICLVVAIVIVYLILFFVG